MGQHTPITKLKGVGPKVAEKLQRLNIFSVEDVLFHLPMRYEDRTRIVPIGSLRVGDQAVIVGNIQLTEIKFARKRMLVCHISDGTGRLCLRFFHFSAAQKNSLERGMSIRCFGEVRRGKDSFEIIHPEYKILQDGEEAVDVDAALTPIYPSTEGLQQLSLRGLSEQAYTLLKNDKLDLQELLPANILDELSMPNLREALMYIHFPPPDAPVDVLAEQNHIMQLRLVFEELLAQTISLRHVRAQIQHREALVVRDAQSLIDWVLAELPFNLTNAQQRVIDEIKTDMKSGMPMQRLVQGDVGSGKTLVAVMAALYIIDAGFQVALMAPTEILAEQHYKNISELLKPMDITVVRLMGSLKAAPRKKALQAIESGEAQFVVGTHALFQDEVKFAKLGLLVIDEQHRFGVHQRLALREKGVHDGIHPHQLIMTATPIPRTLTMTAYADLDCSIIDELPPGRKPIDTVIVPEGRRADVVQRVSKSCEEGRQAYWVCPLIEESEALQCQTAEDTAAALAEALPERKIGLVHGRIKAPEKKKIMQAFKAHKIDLLVATTVIEVGVDVPNASLMVIENAERFGLSQLHQLRGRVGRGTQDSICVLMYHGRLSQTAKERLAIMRETNDGFKIAEKDLQLRGPGEVLGTRQTGLAQYRIADLLKHQSLLPMVNRWTDHMITQHPDKSEQLVQRWLANNTQYADA